jgi:mono/diheme cytochrome c family protein
VSERRSSSHILNLEGGRGAWLMAAGCVLMLSACGQEARVVEAEVAQTAPRGPDDPRAPYYEGNVYQVAQGGRYFTWYGCGACHGRDAAGPADLADGLWRYGGALDQVYAFIAQGQPHGEGPYAPRIAAEQLWQITAYVRSLEQLPPERRRRQDLDLAGEPEGRRWSGPLT